MSTPIRFAGTQVLIIELCLVICKAIHNHFHQQSSTLCQNSFRKAQHQDPPSFHIVEYFIPFYFHDLNKFCNSKCHLGECAK